MTLAVYREQILEQVVKPWLLDAKKTHRKLVLEEDQDSAHGTSKSNIVKTWKEENGLDTYFNCSSSPDLSPIEDCWQPMKQYIRKFTHWDPEETHQLAMEGWHKRVTQDFINRRILSMPQRLQAVIDNHGKLLAFGGSHNGVHCYNGILRLGEAPAFFCN